MTRAARKAELIIQRTIDAYDDNVPSEPHEKKLNRLQLQLADNAAITLADSTIRPRQTPKYQFAYLAYDQRDFPDTEVKFGTTSDPEKRPYSGRDAFAKRHQPDPLFFCVVELGKMTYSERTQIEQHIRALFPPRLYFQRSRGSTEWHRMDRRWAAGIVRTFRKCGPMLWADGTLRWRRELLIWTPSHG